MAFVEILSILSQISLTIVWIVRIRQIAALGRFRKFENHRLVSCQQKGRKSYVLSTAATAFLQATYGLYLRKQRQKHYSRGYFRRKDSNGYDKGID